MKITRKSLMSGIEHTLELNCTQEQFDAWLGGKLALDAFPNLTADERQFIMSGITPEELNEIFAEA